MIFFIYSTDMKDAGYITSHASNSMSMKSVFRH